MTSADDAVPGFVLVARNGSSGADVAPENPLARATRRLLDEGHRTVSAIPATLSDQAGATFWLGFFALTEVGRVLFFPGFKDRFERIAGGLWDGRSQFDRKLDVDHLTLEANRRTWHITDHSRRRYQRGARTRDVGEGRVLWFCVTTSGPSDFRPLKARTFVPFRPVANEEVARDREARFFACVGNGASSTLSLPERPPGDSALHVAVVVAAPGAPPYDGDGMPFPFAAPGVERIAPATSGVLVRLLLSPAVELQILATWVSGKAPPDGLTFTYSWNDNDGSR